MRLSRPPFTTSPPNPDRPEEERVMPESNPSPESPDNGETAGTAVIHDLEALQTRISDAEQKRDEYLDLLQRTRADFENYQKRALRETRSEERRVGKECGCRWER